MVIVALVVGLAGGYFLRLGTEPTKTAAETTQTTSPVETPLAGPNGNAWPDVLLVTSLADDSKRGFLAPDEVTARVDRFITAFNGAERPIRYWGADSDLWSWNPWMTPSLATRDQNWISRTGPVVELRDLVAFRVEYGKKGGGFSGIWVQKWSPETDVVVRMWVMP